MKQLFLSDNATTVFFEDSVSSEKILDWVNIRIKDSDNYFNLNESHSCDASLCSDGSIVITGDEDYKEITIETITPINIDRALELNNSLK